MLSFQTTAVRWVHVFFIYLGTTVDACRKSCSTNQKEKAWDKKLDQMTRNRFLNFINFILQVRN